MKQLFGVDSFLRNLEHLFQKNKIGIDEVFFYPSGKKQCLESGADSERGDALSLRDSTPYRPKGSPSVLIWCQYILILRGSTRQKKNAIFLSKFSKCPKTVFFSKICLRRRQFGHNSVFLVLQESSENRFGRP